MADTAPSGEYVPREIVTDWRWSRHGADFWMNPKVKPQRPDEVWVWREGWGGHPELESFIAYLREAAEGLVDAEIELISEGVDEFPSVYVCGYRPITDYDRERLAKAAAVTEEREREEYEALRAKFEDSADFGRSDER